MRQSFMRQKFTLYLVMVFTMIGTSIQAQVGQGFYNSVNWKFSNPQQFGFTVQDVDYFDNNNAIAVGSDGGIAKTTDGGSNWTYGPFTYNTTANVLTKATWSDVHFVTANVAYAVGSSGAMAKTTDGGANWSFLTTPLFAGSKNINAVWFLNKDTGYIGGQFNTPDSLPKLYVTRNGGASWDSIAAPIANGKTRVGYISNPNIPSVLFDIDAKAKEIYRIEFINDSVGYVCGSGSPLFPRVSVNAVAATCLPSTGNLTTGSHSAGMLWKINKNVITDYSLSKERMGYSGINTNTVTCTTAYGSVNAQSQTYRAMSIINDSIVVLMSFNNNAVVRVNTGKNDSTQNLATPGVYEKGKFFTLNYPFPPTGGPNAGPSIPNPQVLFASNPYQIKKTSNGKLYAAANFGLMWTSIDTGRNWVREYSLPQGKNYSSFATWALDIAPNGKFLSMGQNGVVADSIPGSTWKSNYVTVPATAGYIKVDFADCANGMAAGSSNITVTRDGVKTWIDRGRPDFAASFYNINGMTFPTISKAYFAVSNGTLYFSGDTAITLDPIFSDPLMQMNDVATIGTDSIWAIGYSSFSVAAASRTSKVFRSTNAGTTWTTYSGFSVGSLAQNLTDIKFPTSLIGYAAGNRDTIYKTTDGGVTWNKLPLPFPGVTPQIQYRDMQVLDANTVFLVGIGFPRKVVIKTTDGGATWTDITSNIATVYPVGNLTGIMMHDVNNGYVVGPGGALLITNNGGATWRLDIAPTNCLYETAGFAPRTVPASIPFANRRLFVTGANISGAAIMEYGNPTNTNVNSTDVVTNATCTNLTAGSITVNATGGLAPYTYSINGGSFQSSNSFTGLTQGVKTITVKDAFCGKLTKTLTVGFTDNLTLTSNNDTTVCAGAPVQMIATSAATTYSWLPSTGLSNAAISNPIAIVNGNTTYQVTASINGCVRTKNVNIVIRQNPFVTAGADKTIVDGAAVQLNGAGASNVLSISWTPAATLTGANTFTPIAKPSTTTTYSITVRDGNSCTSSDDATVTVIPYCIKVMNAFTPNGDGTNDKWIVTTGAACTEQIMVKVFNRYGSEVYSNDNYKNDWDGQYKGKPVPDGTYYYVINFRLIGGRVVPTKGDVTILR
jgi:gliding motility-associated-like protein